MNRILLSIYSFVCMNVLFVSGPFDIPHDLPAYASLRKLAFENMVARPLQDIYPDFTQRQFNETPHQATTVLDGSNVNVHGEAPGPLPEEVKREMLHTIKFRRPTNSQKKWTWTKLRIKNDTTLGRNGGQGTSHTSKSDVCAVVWLHYDKHWKSYVLRN